MSNRRSYVKNQPKQTKTNPSKTNKFKKPAIYAGILLAGILCGWFANMIFKTKAQSASMNEVRVSMKKNTSELKFVNPYILTSVYDSIQNKELSHFKYLISEYCNKAKKDADVTEIAYYFRDLTTGYWFGINEREKFIPASLAKVPIMIATFQIAQKNPEYLNKKIVFKESWAQKYLKEHPEIDDTRTVMVHDSSYTVEELVNFMITKSDNEASMMLAYDFGKEHWDKLQNRLGRSVSLEAPANTNVLTVKGYSSFFRMLYNASILNREYSNKALEILSRSEYSYGIREAIPANIAVAQKYGERDTLVTPTKLDIRQLHHAAIVYYPGKTFFICIMTRGKNKVKLKSTISDLAGITYNEVERQVKIFKLDKFNEDLN